MSDTERIARIRRVLDTYGCDSTADAVNELLRDVVTLAGRPVALPGGVTS